MSLDEKVEVLVRALVDVVRAVVQEGAAGGEPRPTAEPEVGFLSIAGSAKHVGMHPSTVRQWIKAGKLATYGPPRALRVKRADLEAAMRRTAPEGTIDIAEQARQLRVRRAAQKGGLT